MDDKTMVWASWMLVQLNGTPFSKAQKEKGASETTNDWALAIESETRGIAVDKGQ
jgi:hypothetical protein